MSIVSGHSFAEETPKRRCTGIFIPIQIWEDETLTFFEKMLFAEIDSREGNRGYFASHTDLAKFFRCSERHIRSGIKSLKEKGYISKEIV